MVNLVAAQRPLLHALMKMAGVVPYSLHIEPGTVINFWLPLETICNIKKGQPPQPPQKPTKPVVILIHGFAAEGIVTWQFQVGALSKQYSVYVPDLLFFGGSITDKADRSPAFQAECLAIGLRKLGIEKCTVVGFSYGGMVAFKLAELQPELVDAMVISGSILAMTDSISGETLQRLGFESSSELLLPTSVKGLKALLSVAAHKKLWFPDRLHKDFLEVMFNNRKDRAELLQGLIISNKDTTVPKFTQKIHLLWGENDEIFKVELAWKRRRVTWFTWNDLVSTIGVSRTSLLPSVNSHQPCFTSWWLFKRKVPNCCSCSSVNSPIDQFIFHTTKKIKRMIQTFISNYA